MPDNNSTPLIDRFMAKVSPEPNSGCWLWMGACAGEYGYIGLGGGRHQGIRTAHRVAYELFKGPVPDGLHIDHLCRVTCCVNPDHMEAVTQQENNRRQMEAYRQKGRPTHCRKGHEYATQNPVFRKDGSRACRLCARRVAERYKPQPKPRQSYTKTHCINGHEFTVANVRWYKAKRVCRECHKSQNAAAYTAKKNGAGPKPSAIE